MLLISPSIHLNQVNELHFLMCDEQDLVISIHDSCFSSVLWYFAGIFLFLWPLPLVRFFFFAWKFCFVVDISAKRHVVSILFINYINASPPGMIVVLSGPLNFYKNYTIIYLKIVFVFMCTFGNANLFLFKTQNDK